ncbi:MAG: trypsin-like peptidase domain-containing protein [Rhizonema sp. PD38]|nr:trypsin-like peptidase domain-containing protein [Rhizonema sp. PD38]
MNNHRRKATSSVEFLEDLKRRFNQKVSAHTFTYTLISPVEAINNSNQYDTNLLEEYIAVKNIFYYAEDSISTWTDENVMIPELFLEQNEIAPLENTFDKLFTLYFDDSSSRRSLLTNAGVDALFLRNISLNVNAGEFTSNLVAKFIQHKISYQKLNYHPLLKVLEYLIQRQESYELEDLDLELFTRLLEKGHENFKAISSRSAVGRIESPRGNPIGTGVLINNNFLLTCHHIFSKSQVQKAWVRFGYIAETHNLDKDVFELDFISQQSRSDYSLLKIKGQPQQQKAIYINNDAILDSGQEIRIIHHPQGKPVVISDLGQITQVGEDYIDYNLSTDNGSSGAPIFNRQWEMIAIHQGKNAMSRNLETGTTSGIPVRAIWNEISSYLN